jgi:hypothetical protein
MPTRGFHSLSAELDNRLITQIMQERFFASKKIGQDFLLI